MASIVVSGDTSGAVTIEAPAIAGSPTLTLPTTSGTILTTAGGQTVPFAAGSAAAPSITFTGDTNTGIFSPAADTIAFSEGGVESMRIDSSGRVGIGTASPTYTLEVATGTSGQQALANFRTANSTSTNNAGLQIYATPSATAASRSVIAIWDADGADSSSGDYFYINKLGNSGNVEIAQYSDASMIFSTNVGTERMRITSGGNVGIGTSSPGRKLHVNGDIRTVNCLIEDSGTNVNFGTFTAGYLGLQANGAERMRIDSAGNVGIGNTPSGTSATGYRSLELGTTAGTGITAGNGDFYVPVNAYVAGGAWKYATTSTASLLNIQGGLFTWSNAGSGTAGNNISFSERMRIDSSGNVLIGTTSAATSSTLNVVGAGYQPIYVNTTATGGGGASFQRSGTLALYTGTAGSTWLTGSSTADGLIRAEANLLFAAGGGSTERMRITSGGTLLVGTTTETTLSSVIWKTTLSGGGNNLAVVNTSTNGSTTSGFQASNYTVSGANIINFYNGSGSLAGVISVPTNGSTGTTVNYGTSSDYRMKENIAPMIGALNKVLQLNPVTYTWKSNGYAGQGFIAHELQAVVPDCVTGEKDAVDAGGNPVYQGVDTSFLVATLTKAIQEQQSIIEELKARIETLEAK